MCVFCVLSKTTLEYPGSKKSVYRKKNSIRCFKERVVVFAGSFMKRERVKMYIIFHDHTSDLLRSSGDTLHKLFCAGD